MREASIILPTEARLTEDTQGIARNSAINRGQLVRAELTAALLDTFGGATVHLQNGHGYWRGDDGTIHAEQVWIFTVAIDAHDIRNRYALRTLATEAARKLNQLAVYIRQPSGEVEIIDLPQEGE